MRTIRQKLLLWLLGGMMVCTVAAGTAIYFVVDVEADDIFDYQLQQIVLFWPAHFQPGPLYTRKEQGQHDADFLVQVWDSSGKLVFASQTEVPMPRIAGRGFVTLKVGNQRWRIFAETRRTHFVQAAQPMSVRQKIAEKTLLVTLAPIVALIGLLAALIWVAVGNALRPLKRVAAAVSRRSAEDLEPLPTRTLPPDIRPMVQAINDLLKRLGMALDSQRIFIADAAHELRTPLTAVRLQLQLAQRATTGEKRNAAFANLDEGLKRVTHLVQQLLALARSEHEALESGTAPVDLEVLAQQVVADRAALAESRSIDLGASLKDGKIMVRGSADELRTLLGNLVDNALLYSGSGGRVDVTALTLEGRPALRVVDDGPGIPAQDRERVFERFTRLNSNGQTGTGLGLAIVKNIAERHGALVRLSQGAGGNGLEVTVLFLTPVQS